MQYIHVSIKYWLRIHSLEFKNQLVGKAAQKRIQKRYQGQGVKFSDFPLNMCNFEPSSSEELHSNDTNNVVKKLLNTSCVKDTIKYGKTRFNSVTNCDS